MTILDEIVAAKRAEIAEQRAAGYFAPLRRQRVSYREIRDFTGALRAGLSRISPPGSPAASLRPSPRKLSRRGYLPDEPENAFGVAQNAAGAVVQRVSLIAEVKRASPSRGVLRADLDPVETACLYAANGADAISVLTERRFFQGDPAYLGAIRQAVDVPLLRKDFIVEADQVFESRAIGADAILLIAAILSLGQLDTLLGLAGELGLHCLVEVHTEAELDRALAAGARVIGINNRDLRSFHVDLEVTRRLARLVPSECVVVAESGIFTAADVRQVGAWGAHAVLVGEALVRESDIGVKVRELAGATMGATMGATAAADSEVIAAADSDVSATGVG